MMLTIFLEKGTNYLIKLFLWMEKMDTCTCLSQNYLGKMCSFGHLHALTFCLVNKSHRHQKSNLLYIKELNIYKF